MDKKSSCKLKDVIGPIDQGVRTRRAIAENANCLYGCFISNIEPKTIEEALKDQDWISEMQEELVQFERNKVCNRNQVGFQKQNE